MAGDVLNFKNFINLSEEEKELVLQWRNSDRVRLRMNNSNIIELQDHMRWINGLKDNKETLYFLFEINGNPAGVFDYSQINNTDKTCVCGSYIGDENYLGYGILLNYFGFEYAFSQLDTERINISVLKSNKRVFEMHKNIFNAKLYRENDKEYFMYLDKNIDKEKILTLYDVESVKWEKNG